MVLVNETIVSISAGTNHIHHHHHPRSRGVGGVAMIIWRALLEKRISLRLLDIMILFGFMLLYYSSYTSVMMTMLHQNYRSTMEGKLCLTNVASSSSLLNSENQKAPGMDTTTAVKDHLPRRLCTENPYQNALSDSLEVIARRADAWLEHLPQYLVQARNDDLYRLHDHARFFPFDDNMTNCLTKDCVGGACSSDLSKVVCGLAELQKQPSCVVYSIGGNNQWDFELELLQKTPCEIHTFDCTGRLERFQKPPHERLHFHHVCIGTQHRQGIRSTEVCEGRKKCGPTWTLWEMQHHLKHDKIDLFKADIEGWEWPLFKSWPLLSNPDRSRDVNLPMQILVEVHYQSVFEERLAMDIVKLQTRLLKMGYIVVVRDDNPQCLHCTELTLMRYRCPANDNKRTSSGQPILSLSPL